EWVPTLPPIAPKRRSPVLRFVLCRSGEWLRHAQKKPPCKGRQPNNQRELVFKAPIPPQGGAGDSPTNLFLLRLAAP
ncbi:MAG TPA: hypothetical protein VJK48_04405, partial [Chlamydiales bacterium]|nr:hypothetical protein [Chlamydiales bacterium]